MLAKAFIENHDEVLSLLEIEVGDDKAKITYHGTLEGDAKMKGTAEFGSLGKGTFTAMKQ